MFVTIVGYNTLSEFLRIIIKELFFLECKKMLSKKSIHMFATVQVELNQE